MRVTINVKEETWKAFLIQSIKRDSSASSRLQKFMKKEVEKDDRSNKESIRD